MTGKVCVCIVCVCVCEVSRGKGYLSIFRKLPCSVCNITPFHFPKLKEMLHVFELEFMCFWRREVMMLASSISKTRTG